jgi:hypothetical protein
MTTATRRAPAKARRFTVLRTFRYQRRKYEAGAEFVPPVGTPRLRLDRLWIDGSIGTLDGARCPNPRHRPAAPAEVQRSPALTKKNALKSLAEKHGVDTGD